MISQTEGFTDLIAITPAYLFHALTTAGGATLLSAAFRRNVVVSAATTEDKERSIVL